jgi:hypothetical protein
MIGPINLDMKQTGERSAGNRPAAFDVAWNHHRRLPVRAPVLDPTDERVVETGLRRGYSGTAKRKGRKQTNRT